MKTTIIILVLATAGFVAYKKFFAKKSASSAAPATPAAPDSNQPQQ